MNNNIINKKIGSDVQKGKVIDIDIKSTVDKYGKLYDKLYLKISNNTNMFVIDDIITDEKNPVLGGLWIKLDKDDNLNLDSNVCKLLKFYNCESLEELIDKEVLLKPKRNGFLSVLIKNNNFLKEDEVIAVICIKLRCNKEITSKDVLALRERISDCYDLRGLPKEFDNLKDVINIFTQSENLISIPEILGDKNG